MPRLTLSDSLCCLRVIITCHVRRRPNVCATQGTCGHANTDVIRPYVQSKGDDGMPHDWVCCRRAMMACNARCHPTMCAAYGRYGRATPNIIQPCVIPKGDDGMSSPTSSGHLCCPMPMRSCHARRHLTMCAIQRQ